MSGSFETSRVVDRTGRSAAPDIRGRNPEAAGEGAEGGPLVGPCSPRCRCQDGQPRSTPGRPRQNPDRHPGRPRRPLPNSRPTAPTSIAATILRRPRRSAPPLNSCRRHPPRSSSIPPPARPNLHLNPRTGLSFQPIRSHLHSTLNPVPQTNPDHLDHQSIRPKSKATSPSRLSICPLTPPPHNRVGAGSGARSVGKRRSVKRSGCGREIRAPFAAPFAAGCPQQAARLRPGIQKRRTG